AHRRIDVLVAAGHGVPDGLEHPGEAPHPGGGDTEEMHPPRAIGGDGGGEVAVVVDNEAVVTPHPSPRASTTPSRKRGRNCWMRALQRPSAVRLVSRATESWRGRSTHRLVPVKPRWPNAPGARFPMKRPALLAPPGEGVSKPRP